MKFFFYFFIFVLAILVGLALKIDPGYVLIAYHHWTAEMPLWFGILALIIIFLLFHFSIRLFHAVENSSSKWQEWIGRHRLDKATCLMKEGFEALILARWKDAEKALIKGVPYSNVPVFHYLGAAIAAQKLESIVRRDKYLYKAYNCVSDNDLVVGVVQAQLQLESQQTELVLANLKNLNEVFPKQFIVLQLLSNLYQELDDWESLIELLPQIQKTKAATKDEIEHLEIEIYSNLLSKVSDQAERLKNIWHTMPRKLHRNPRFVYLYSVALSRCNENETATKLIVDYINRQSLDDDLVDLFGTIAEGKLEKLINSAENWLRKQPRNTHLLDALARLSMRCHYWNKAEEYLSISQSIEKSEENYMMLGYIYEQKRDVSKALEFYRKGYQFTV